MSEFKLQRWNNYQFFEDVYEDSDGRWVKWEDVEPLLKAYLYLIHGRKDDLSITEIEGIEP